MHPTREQLFAVLCREHLPALTAFVRSCVLDRHAADDVAQETLVSAWQRLADYDASRPFAGWLRGIAKHKINDLRHDHAIASQRFHIMAPEQIDAIASEFEELTRPSRGEACMESFAALRECLQSLAIQEQAVIERAYHGGESCRLIAQAMGQTVEAIKKRLQRARAQLRDCILGKLAAGNFDA